MFSSQVCDYPGVANAWSQHLKLTSCLLHTRTHYFSKMLSIFKIFITICSTELVFARSITKGMDELSHINQTFQGLTVLTMMSLLMLHWKFCMYSFLNNILKRKNVNLKAT